MDRGQMRDRCPSARFVGVAKLPDHKLAFTRKSQRRKCGVADAVREPGSSVWGVVWEIDERDLGKLDRAEGYSPNRDEKDNSYRREQRHVFLDGDENQPLVAEVYFANHELEPPLPNQEYKDLIVNGARYWRLPEDYIRDVLDAIQVGPPSGGGQ
ncbi:MAG: gamma-glutamylcyclotransferase [Bryobacteraceae bacterium]|nr:gamma-glutamylcyclotransferase [Bryobacteraceae bacterium]